MFTYDSKQNRLYQVSVLSHSLSWEKKTESVALTKTYKIPPSSDTRTSDGRRVPLRPARRGQMGPQYPQVKKQAHDLLPEQKVQRRRL